MKLYEIIFAVSFLIAVTVPCEGLFNGESLQDYIDRFVDRTKARWEDVVNLNDSAVNRIWNYFKTKYDRVYSSSGL